MKAAAFRPQSAGYTTKTEWGKGGSGVRWERRKNDEWGRRGRDRWGATDDGGARETFCGLQSRVVEVYSYYRLCALVTNQAVARSSDFVDDIKRLRRVRGIVRRTASASSLAAMRELSARGEGRWAQQQELAKSTESKEVVSSAQVPKGTAESFGVIKIIDQGQELAMMGFDKATRGVQMGEARRRGVRSSRRPHRWPMDEAFVNSRVVDDNYFSPSSITAQHPVPSPEAALPSPVVIKQKGSRYPRENGERLQRAVRDIISSTLEGRGGGQLHGASRRRRNRRHYGWDGRDFRAPKWSQKHEAVLSDLRRRMREAGSPLVQAKDPAVLIGALLKREPATVARLDEGVLALEGIAEALDALVFGADRLRDAGVSADGIFTRAGVVRTGGSNHGSKPVPSNHDATTEGGDGIGGGRETRRCTIKRVYAEIQRVLVGDVASYRQFCMALKACMREGEDRGGAAKGRSGSATEWITVDQLDHALRICHITRRTLDPQGASHPPLTGKRVAYLLEAMRRSTESRKSPLCDSSYHVPFASRGTTPSSIRCKHGTTKQTERMRRAHARAEKWTEDDRELAEREIASGIVERQQKFVEGYVRERRRYLNRRVAAQREGYGKFHTNAIAGGASGNCIGGQNRKEAVRAEFREAVNRTKIVLKLLEPKVASPASCTPSPGVTPTVAARSWGKRNRVSFTNLERRHASRERFACPLASTHAAPGRKAPIIRGEHVNDKSRERSVCTALRRSTEEYSDRVGNYGGGTAKYGVLVDRCHPSRPRGSGTKRMVSTGGGGEAATMNAAVLAVQMAFRRRMFHRLVWAQSYLRRPMHAFSIFKRACRPRLLTGANTRANFVVAATAATDAQRVDVQSATSTAVFQSINTRVGGGNLAMVKSLDAWPEAPGFYPAAPYHTHAADVAFFEYLKWRRQEATTARGARVSSTPLEDGQAVALEMSSVPQATPPSRTQGIQIFARKYAIRTEAMRSTLFDLHLPFIPGALDSAIEDLDRTIDAETSLGAGDNGPRSSREVSYRPVVATSSGVERARIQNRSHNSTAQRGEGLSFVNWYAWWVRHLPYDLGSTTYMLKTIRCAKNLHSAEVAAAAAKTYRLCSTT